MSLVTRQQSLFAAEDWKVAYRAYTEVDFQAYDFDSIRTALVEYVRANYPESFNDYIESSEFIAIIELLAYLSQSLAFRMDVNTRENFLETAERRDSVFKLARMLGYSPKRNIAASGLVKVTALSTTEQLSDSQGTALNNLTVFWDDVNNPQSYEQFITILNSAMAGNNRFSEPVKSGTVGGIQTETYQLETPVTAPLAYQFRATISGRSRPFEVVNADFDDGGKIYERHPDPVNNMNILYRNDGKGVSSKDTGFFFLFKQGSLDKQDFNFTTPVQGRTQTVGVNNINETDVYLQEINSAGSIINKWQRVPNTVGQTLNYNSISLNTRNLYAIENLGTGGIQLRFTDGNFGRVPTGIFRLWYRTSEPSRFTIQPEDIRSVNVKIPYIDRNGAEQTLTMTLSLQSRVNNSLPEESLAAIKQRAPQVYYTQNRMVNGQDYTVFPLGQSTDILKLNAINRTYAGHSRYIDLNDPTGTYENVDSMARDAILFVEDSPINDSIVVNDNNTPSEIVASTLPQFLKEQSLNNFVYYGMRNNTPSSVLRLDQYNIRWNPLPVEPQSAQGYLSETFTAGGDRSVLINSIAEFALIKENNFLKFVNPQDLDDYKWVRIVRLDNNGALVSGLSTSQGPIGLSASIPQDWICQQVIVSLRKTFNATESREIVDVMTRRETFALAYDVGAGIGDNIQRSVDRWRIIDASKIDFENDYDITTSGNDTNGTDASWLILMEYQAINTTSYRYRITVRGQDYVVQSIRDLKFYNLQDAQTVGSDGRSGTDTITFTTLNHKPSVTETVEWFNLSGDNFAWRNTETGALTVPTELRAGIPIQTRNTRWHEVSVDWVSNFGILRPEDSDGVLSLSNIVAQNRFVNEASVNLNTSFDTGLDVTYESNVIIPNNSGQISRLPSNIDIVFDATTFGINILDDNGNITYRQRDSAGVEVVFHGGTGGVYSYGNAPSDVTVPNVLEPGKIQLIEADPITQTGRMRYSVINQNDYFVGTDSTNRVSSDQIAITYDTNRDTLDRPIVWNITGVYRYSDGFTDPRKVIVAPVDNDGDLVPDRPLQFLEFVNVDDIYLYEYYQDFDGYRYDRPFEGTVLDLRSEREIAVNFTLDTIGPTSYNQPTRLSGVEWLLVDSLDIATSKFEQPSTQGRIDGLLVYAQAEDRVYQATPVSTILDPETGLPNDVQLVETQEYFIRQGRGPTQNDAAPVKNDVIIRWEHVAPSEIRIDPSISNVVEMIVLTETYNNQVQAYLANPSRVGFPAPPTTAELNNQFENLNNFKSASDTMIFRSAKFRMLFGADAEPEFQARFRVVKLNEQISDNEVKTQVIRAFNEYFDINNWEFGETFYFTELSSYIHQKLGSLIGSIVILPKNSRGQFGDLFQVKAETNELFVSTATVNDIEIVEKFDFKTLNAQR